jgi:hypothetical protein
METTTIEPEQTTRRSGIVLPYSTVIGAVALIFAGFVGLGGLPAQQSPAIPPTLALAPTPPAAGQGAPDVGRPELLLVYLVATEAEKRTLSQDIRNSPEWFAESYRGSQTDVRVVAVGAHEDESLEALTRQLAEASLTTLDGAAIKLIDMRR